MESINNNQITELKYLLDQIKNYNLKAVDIDEIAPASDVLKQHDFTQILKNNHKDYIIIDVRSENEFLLNKIPFSINLPILNNIERHNVGLIYARHSEKTAISLACYYAEKKERKYIECINNITAENPGKVIVYCWRGGYRSKYVAKLFHNNNIDTVILEHGYKGFRKIIYELLYYNTIPIVSLSGATGCGKSEILEYIQETYPDFPVLHLEQCAGHASSVFGEIRFSLRGQKTQNQQQFETNIFMQLLPHLDKQNTLPVFLAEKESRKIGNLLLPPAILNGLLKEIHISIICSIEARIKRLTMDYFAINSSDEIKNNAKEKIKQNVKAFTNKFGNEKIEFYNYLLDNGQYSEFLEDIIKIHYDFVYKKPKKQAIAVIEHTNMSLTIYKIFEVMEGAKGMFKN